MKYIVLLCDGMSDIPVPELGGRTPMETAKKPIMDALCKKSTIGMCKTVAQGLSPGSDVANLSVLGYDPFTCYSGRSPLEAANLGITLTDTQIALRCNLVTLSEAQKYEDRIMLDYCGGDISTDEAAELIAALQQAFGDSARRFYPGVQYRHCLVYENGSIGLDLTPPHDISDKVVGKYLSKNPKAQPFIDLMKKSVEILENHPVNLKRKEQGKRPANAAWLWGEGGRPNLELFKEKFGVSGGVVSAVDLIKGIGRLAGMAVAQVPGATGYIDTNFEGKAAAALEFLRERDFVFLHIEAPDECGHRGEVENKVLSIELIDDRVLRHILAGLRESGEQFRILIMPDHPTPLATKTHTSDPVPFMIYDSRKDSSGADCFTEESAKNSGVHIENGTDLMPMFLGN